MVKTFGNTHIICALRTKITVVVVAGSQWLAALGLAACLGISTLPLVAGGCGCGCGCGCGWRLCSEGLKEG